MADFLFDVHIIYTDTSTYDCTVDVTNAGTVALAKVRVAAFWPECRDPGRLGGKTVSLVTATERSRT